MSSSEMSSSAAPAGCSLSPIDPAQCHDYISWVLGEACDGAPSERGGLLWTLAHCDDGVTWGRHEARSGLWSLASAVAPDVSPPIRRDTLQELRLFGESGEVLIWRTDTGFRGRVLLDTDPAVDATDKSNPLRPSEESRILRGEHVIAQYEHNFTHVGDGRGVEQILPIGVTEQQLRCAHCRLDVRHYYDQNPLTGAVRVTATRLVRLISGGTHGA